MLPCPAKCLKAFASSVSSMDHWATPHKLVWYNRKPAEFAAILKGKTLGRPHSRGRWLFIPLQPGYVLVFGECGGKILRHESGSWLPKKYHLTLQFENGSFLSATTQMWGAMELYEEGKELERQYIKGMRLLQLIRSSVWNTCQRSSRNAKRKEADL